MLEGWQALVAEDGVNWITFDTSEHVSNISYTISISEDSTKEGDFLLIGHRLYQDPDSFQVLGNGM